MSTSDNNTPPPDERDDARRRSPEFEQALGDLERAVMRLAGTAQKQMSARAMEAIEEATARLRRYERRYERRTQRAEEAHPSADSSAAADSARSDTPPPPPPPPRHGDARAEHDTRDTRNSDSHDRFRRAREYDRPAAYRAAGDYRQERWQRRAARMEHRRERRARRRERLVRVPAEGVIGGVCAGIARRFGLETWVVRCMAVTGLVFMPQFIVIGYIVLFFVARQVTPAEADAVFGASASGLGRDPIAGFDRAANPRGRLRSIRSTFDAQEQRLRRIESYVTSSRFELDRALRDIDEPS